jgi:DNA-binding transcriptional LysR family regulator
MGSSFVVGAYFSSRCGLDEHDVLPDHQMTLGAMYAVYPRAKPLPPKVRAFTSHLREHVPRLLDPA